MNIIKLAKRRNPSGTLRAVFNEEYEYRDEQFIEAGKGYVTPDAERMRASFTNTIAFFIEISRFANDSKTTHNN